MENSSCLQAATEKQLEYAKALFLKHPVEAFEMLQLLDEVVEAHLSLPLELPSEMPSSVGLLWIYTGGRYTPFRLSKADAMFLLNQLVDRSAVA